MKKNQKVIQQLTTFKSLQHNDLIQLVYWWCFLGNPSLNQTGCDIPELMLDFIEWLTQQDFGRRCILSVRDVLSWVNFLNTVCERDEDGFMTMGALEDDEETEWDLRLDTVTAFIHAACLVYIDGIGSGKLMAWFHSKQQIISESVILVSVFLQEPQCPVLTMQSWLAGCAWASCNSDWARWPN